MNLTPATYPCPTHQHDLTDLVREALDEAGPPVAYQRLRLRGRPAPPRPFEVIVTCPGSSPESAHPLTCSGEYS